MPSSISKIASLIPDAKTRIALIKIAKLKKYIITYFFPFLII